MKKYLNPVGLDVALPVMLMRCVVTFRARAAKSDVLFTSLKLALEFKNPLPTPKPQRVE